LEARAMINAKGLEASREGMRCHYRPSWKWRSLIVGELILVVPSLLHLTMNIFWW